MTTLSVTSHEAVPNPQPLLTGMARKEDAMPLPQWLMRVYYIFPIILYVPDVIFNYFVYSKGVSTPFNPYDIATYPENALWLFLALGIVGMAWLLSILAPWHWVRNNRFQSVMCWVGVLIATAITTWNSLAYRMSQTNSPFPTDRWIADTFHITLQGFSPTTILVSISPPFWGLFWAIVQPAERRRSAHEEQQSHEARMLKITLDAEMKAAKANANATVREAQLKGLAASVKAARSQIGAAANATNTEVIGSETHHAFTDRTLTDEETIEHVLMTPHLPASSLGIRRVADEHPDDERYLVTAGDRLTSTIRDGQNNATQAARLPAGTLAGLVSASPRARKQKGS